MGEKYQNRYRIASTRLQNWDYGWNAAYYVTICTKRRHKYFGDIVNGKMNLSAIGVLADVFFYEIKNHGKNVELDTFIVMPNHIHGILVINNDDAPHNPTGHSDGHTAGDNNAMNKNPANDRATERDAALGDVALGDVETRHALSLREINKKTNVIAPRKTHGNNLPIPTGPEQTPGQKRFQNQGKNTLSSLLGSYKSAVTKHAHRLGFEFGWQPRYHDHIIRDAQSWEHIRHYILTNVENWKDDSFY